MSASADELAIRQLAARYIDAVNRRDEGDWTATWSRDGVWNLMGMQVSGRDAVVATWKGAMGTFRWVVMMLGSGTIELDGDTASGRWYLTEHLVGQDGNASMVLGVYDDRYRREEGAWVFSERRYQMLYRGTVEMAGQWQPYQA